MLISCQLVNFAQHRNLRLDLDAGIISVVGPNGSGKTNAMSAVAMALTGKYTMFPGTKSSLIRRGSDEASYVQVVWRLADGGNLEVNRFLKGGTSFLRLNGQRLDVRGEADITTYCEQRIGFESSKFLTQNMVTQNRTDAVIQDTPSDRIKAIASLFDAEDLLMDTSKDLAEESSHTKGYLTSFDSGELPRLQTEKLEIVVRYANKLSATLLAKRSQVSDVMFAEAKVTVELFESRDQLKEQRQLLSSRLSAKTDVKTTTSQLLVTLLATIEKLEASIEESRKRNEQLKLRALIQQKLTLYVSSRQTLNNEISELELIKLPQAPEFKRPDVIKVSEAEAKVRELALEINLVANNEPVCSRCGQTIKIPERSLADLKKEQSDLSQKIKAAGVRTREWEQHDRELADYTAKKPNRELKVLNNKRQLIEVETQLEKSRTELAEHPEPEVKTLVVVDQLLRDLQAARTSQANNQTRLGQIEQVIQQTETELTEVRKRLETAEVKREISYEKAQVIIASRVSTGELLLQLKLDCRELRFMRNQLKKRIAEAQQKIIAVSKWSRWNDVVGSAINAWKPKVMPRAVLVEMMSQVIKPLNVIVNAMHLPYRLTFSESLELIVIHANGDQEPATCLSGGNRAMVAIAFWLAKVLNPSTRVKFIFFDEPAASLDVQAVANLTELLSQLSPVLKHNGVQMAITTHHTQLLNCADYSLSLYE